MQCMLHYAGQHLCNNIISDHENYCSYCLCVCNKICLGITISSASISKPALNMLWNPSQLFKSELENWFDEWGFLAFCPRGIISGAFKSTETDGTMRDTEEKRIVSKIITHFLSPEHRNSDAEPRGREHLRIPQRWTMGWKHTERSTGIL